jgi:pimeloyl-ACP methyl ester carboxylesterase
MCKPASGSPLAARPVLTSARDKEFPEAQLRVISDSDHFLPLEKGEEVSRILIEFFR